MPLIDRRGRIFGRVNLVDGSALTIVALLVAGGATAYAHIRPEPPTFTAAEPHAIPAGVASRLLLTGHALRPYLQAVVAPVGTTPRRAQLRDAEFIGIGDATVGALAVPPLQPGEYDVHVYDTGREIAVIREAFAVAPRSAEGS